MKLIVFVQSCQANADKREWIRKTWKPMFEQRGASVFFSVGGYEETHIHEDEIRLKVEDTYEHLFEKTMSMLNELVKFEWDFLLKTDDDVVFNVNKTILVCNKVKQMDFVGSSYVGAFSMYSKKSALHIVDELIRDEHWMNDDTWEGLERHVEKSKWKYTLPDDIFIKQFLMRSNDLKLMEYIPKYKGKFEDKNKIEITEVSKYVGLHNFREWDDFKNYFEMMNNEK